MPMMQLHMPEMQMFLKIFILIIVNHNNNINLNLFIWQKVQADLLKQLYILEKIRATNIMV